MPKKAVYHELRIIGGSWRSRRFRFPVLPSLRPSPDRVRETLFNWLQSHIAGSRCLDLFAGSGALGLEALSRGAAHVTFVDRERLVVEQLRETLRSLGAENAAVRQMDARRFLGGEPKVRGVDAYDVVFLDPPFGESWIEEIGRRLEQGHWLADKALIYTERASRPRPGPASAAREEPAPVGEPALPPGWTPFKTGRAGDVRYDLFRREVL